MQRHRLSHRTRVSTLPDGHAECGADDAESASPTHAQELAVRQQHSTEKLLSWLEHVWAMQEETLMAIAESESGAAFEHWQTWCHRTEWVPDIRKPRSHSGGKSEDALALQLYCNGVFDHQGRHI
jgi:hypothetical protein